MIPPSLLLSTPTLSANPKKPQLQNMSRIQLLELFCFCSNPKCPYLWPGSPQQPTAMSLSPVMSFPTMNIDQIMETLQWLPISLTVKANILATTYKHILPVLPPISVTSLSTIFLPDLSSSVIPASFLLKLGSHTPASGPLHLWVPQTVTLSIWLIPLSPLSPFLPFFYQWPFPLSCQMALSSPTPPLPCHSRHSLDPFNYFSPQHQSGILKSYVFGGRL